MYKQRVNILPIYYVTQVSLLHMEKDLSLYYPRILNL